jgi:hypothetical protein
MNTAAELRASGLILGVHGDVETRRGDLLA